MIAMHTFYKHITHFKHVLTFVKSPIKKMHCESQKVQRLSALKNKFSKEEMLLNKPTSLEWSQVTVIIILEHNIALLWKL